MIILFASQLLKRKIVLAQNMTTQQSNNNILPKLSIAPSYIIYIR